MLPINLEDTVGKLILRMLFIVPKSGLISSFLIVNFLGKKHKKVTIDAVSDAIDNNIKPITASTIPLSISGGPILLFVQLY